MPTLYTAINASRMTQGAAQGSQAVGVLVGAVQGARAPMHSFNVGLASLGSSAVVTQRALTSLTGSFAVAATIRNLIGDYTAFNREITTLGAVLHIAGPELKVFADAAREVGRTTQYSAIQASEALVQLSRAGFSQKEAIATLKPTLDLAIAGNLGLEQATNIASVTLRQFRIPAEDAARVMDILTTAANQSNTDVEGLAEALKFAAPVAAAAGISLEETAAAIGVLSDAGIKGSLAGTALRGMITSLLAPTPQAIQVFNSLGISVSEVDFRSRGLVGVLERLSRSNIDASNAAEIFTRRQSSGALALLSSIDRLQTLSVEVTKVGEAQRTAQAQGESLEASFRRLRNAMTEVYISTGEGGVGGALKLLTQRTTEAILALLGVHKGAEELSTGARVLIGLFQSLAITVGIFIALKLAVWAATSAAAIWGLATGMRALTAAMASNPLGLIAVGLSVLISTLVGFDAIVPKATSGIDAMGDAALRSKQKMEQFTASLEAIGNLNPRWARAIRVADLDEQVAIVAERIGMLKRLRNELLVDPQNVDAGSLRAALGGASPPSVVSQVQRQIAPDQDTLAFYRRYLEEGRQRQELMDLSRADNPFDTRGSDPRNLVQLGEVIDEIAQRTKTWTGYTVDAKASIDAIDHALAHFNPQLEELQRKLANSRTPLEIENQNKFSAVLAKVRSDLEFERQMVGKSADERAVLTEKRRLETEAAKLGVRQGQLAINMLTGEMTAVRALTRAKEEEAALEKQRTEQRRNAAQSVADLMEQITLLGIANDRERTIAEAAYQARQNASSLPAAELASYMGTVEELTGKIWDLRDAEKKRNEEQRKAEQLEENKKQAIQAIKDQIEALHTEANTYGLTAEARARYIAVAHAEIALRKAGVDSTEALTKALDKQMLRLQEYQAWQARADRTSEEFTDTLAQIAVGSKSAADGLRDLANSLEMMVLKEIALAPLKAGISSSFLSFFQNIGLAPVAQAMGGVWNSGQLTPFASGGVVSHPTTFPTASGTGLMGEAGPEAIMPLGRDSQGRLGVTASGQGGKTVIVNMKVSTNDADSFRRNRRAIVADLKRI